MPDHEDQELDKFIQKKLKGNKYEIGRAYYEFVFNKEDIPEGREVILMDKVCCTCNNNIMLCMYCILHDDKDQSTSNK